MVKDLPEMQEMWVQSLGWADVLEKEMATHRSLLAWRIPWTEEPGRLQSVGSQRAGHDLATKQQRHREVKLLLEVRHPESEGLSYIRFSQ